MGADCFYEIVLYDDTHWYNVFNTFRPVKCAIRYDKDTYVIEDGHKAKKIPLSKIKDRITHTETQPCDCRNLVSSRVWLDNTIMQGHEFEDQRKFLTAYIMVVGGVKCGK